MVVVFCCTLQKDLHTTVVSKGNFVYHCNPIQGGWPIYTNPRVFEQGVIERTAHPFEYFYVNS